jgi:hypothetical protein
VTKVNGMDAADIAGKAEAEGGESMPSVGNYAGWLALKSHGWKPVNSTGGKVTFAHPEVGGTFHVDEAGDMTNDTSGTKIKAADATEYLRGSTPTRKVQAAAQAKKEVQAPAAPPSGTTTSTATSRTATRRRASPLARGEPGGHGLKVAAVHDRRLGHRLLGSEDGQPAL